MCILYFTTLKHVSKRPKMSCRGIENIFPRKLKHRDHHLALCSVPGLGALYAFWSGCVPCWLSGSRFRDLSYALREKYSSDLSHFQLQWIRFPGGVVNILERAFDATDASGFSSGRIRESICAPNQPWSLSFSLDLFSSRNSRSFSPESSRRFHCS
jgi:hypothetical protein